jgi:hypothetical protein
VVFEAGDPEVVVIELVVEWFEESMQLAEVDEPSRVGVDRTFDGELDAEAVAVQAKTLVRLRQTGQPVSRFESEFMDEPHVHRARL